MDCIKIGLPGKLILGGYFPENVTSRRPFLLLRISFPGRPVFIQLPPAAHRRRLRRLRAPADRGGRQGVRGPQRAQGHGRECTQIYEGIPVLWPICW